MWIVTRPAECFLEFRTLAIKGGAIIAVFKLLLMLQQNATQDLYFLFPPNPELINKLCCASTPQVVSDFKIH